jgi:thiamine-phosphate pyrophosphorylase
MTDPVRLPDPIPILQHLPRGSGVVFRCYGDRTGLAERLSAARKLRAACRARGLLLLIAGDDGLAHAVRADGIHLAEWRLKRGGWKRGPARCRQGLITAAAHGRAALRRAASAGVDACLLAPVFATASHPDADVLGPRRFTALTRSSRVAVYALGGVGPRTVSGLRGSGAVGIAGIGGLGA